MDTHELHHATVPGLGDPFSRRACDVLGLDVEYRDGGLRLLRRAGRQWTVTAATAAFGLLLLIAPLAIQDPAVEMAVAARAAKAATTLFGIFLLLLALYQASAVVSVRVDRGRIERIRTWGGIVLHRRLLDATEIDDLRIYTAAPSPRVSYDLVCRGTFGSLALISGARDRDLLERLRRQIMLTAGIRPSGTH